jgi:hypothetical protein
MAVEDAVLALGPSGTASPFGETGALKQCERHPEIWVRVGDRSKEQRAYHIADTRLRGLASDEQEAAKSAMTAPLTTAADRFCPICLAERCQ